MTQGMWGAFNQDFRGSKQLDMTGKVRKTMKN
jgi:hypothetical protein